MAANRNPSFQKEKFFGFASALALVMVLGFQNCAPGFRGVGPASQSGSSMGYDFLPLYIANDTSGTNVDGQDITFSAHLDGATASTIYAWTLDFNGATGGCLSRSGSTSSQFVVRCSRAGTLVVHLTAGTGNTYYGPAEFTVPISSQGTPSGGGSGSGGGITISLNIPAGTGNASWNSAITKLELIVGENLKVTNNDSVAHQLGLLTGGNCDSTASIAAGGSATCLVSAAADGVATKVFYDKLTMAQIYVMVYSPSTEYSTNCMGCHGAAPSNHPNASVSTIKAAIATNKGGMGSLSGLTDRQIEAISKAMIQ